MNEYGQWPQYDPTAPVRRQIAAMQQPQGIGQPMQQGPRVICQPVTSIDEARAVPVDFWGALLVLPDLGHGAIYTKQFDQSTGAARFLTYHIQKDQEVVQPQPQPEQYASVADVKQLAEIVQALSDDVAALKRPAQSGRRKDEINESK